MNQYFISCVEREFLFLENCYGYVKQSAHLGQVVYDSKNIQLSIIYDYMLSYELSAFIKDKSLKNEVAYTLEEVLLVVAAPLELKTSWQVVSEENIEKYTVELAQLISKYARQVLLGDYNILQKLYQQRAKACDDLHLKNLKLIAANAWKIKDYITVVKELKSIEGKLSPLEQARLDYSLKVLKKV